MEKLIEGLQILLKYGNPQRPTHCEHDVLYILIHPKLVDEIDILRLEELGIHAYIKY